MRKLETRLFGFQLTNIISMVLLFLLAFAIALAALVLSSLLWTRQIGNATTVCDGCPGIIDFILTDNSTLSPIINQTLKFNGECGLQTFINALDNITIIDFRSLSQYIVGQDNCSEFTTPQDAYDQAILDGKGGDSGQGAIIIIKPGNYDFSGTQFPVLQTGITFYGLPGGSVFFSSTDTTSGIYINTSPDALTSVVFNGISFGAINDTNGFILNISSGKTIIDTCYCMDSNFRIYLGTENATTLESTNSIFKPLPPNDFITGVGSDIDITFENVKLDNQVVGTQGGHIFNLANGFNELNLLKIYFIFKFYNGTVLGPLSNPPYTTVNLIFMRGSSIEGLFSGVINYFALQSGSLIYDIGGSIMSFQGPFIAQLTDSTTPGDFISIKLFACDVETANSTIEYSDSVTVIGTVLIQIINDFLVVTNDDDIIYIPGATAGDVLEILLTGTTLRTASAPGGTYITGPNPALAFLSLASSVSINGATTANGVTKTVIPFLA